MINLIPNQEKKKKVQDFYFRFLAVFIAVLGFCIVVGAVSFLPTYFLSSAGRTLAREKLEAQQNEPPTRADQNLSAVAAELDRKLDQVESAKRSEYLISRKIINEIVVRKMADIKITKFTYENDGTEGRKVAIQGQAPSRERLLLFRRALENGVVFKKVELPISNFVKGSNIEFNLSLIPY
ncbi:MAG: hypothetical protein UY01_C0006G0036 [Candidatus Nomurabacteria bacterium GW2011_GWB1_47_6]|uniref:Fimbrial assembly family protein n=1 Tax=Candidatus Nomurabacteria bacterium GW2011_GWB1_47_6 TaxID=1618749 RepID=A0A0G1T1U5_9BACT|nr:MAG: hypothetical protein UY01_C0006G0036 [Candidatus Nomurabacteria bacterium GW2011_GWB1_47_6]